MSKKIPPPVEIRNQLVAKMSEKEKKRIVSKTVHFTNKDIPAYLKRLDAFEAASAKADYVLR